MVGVALFFGLRWLLADYGSWYWMAMGALAVLVMVFAPHGIWGLIHKKTGIELLPMRRRLLGR
jgi:branched-chain amino acid transport system permease protein